MDTTQPKGRLKAFFKHATIRISSTKDHGFPNDSASAHSIDDDGRSQRSSISAKKDSKLRRIGRGIREWRSKRKRLRGDTRQRTSFNLEGKSFSSSEASLPQGSFDDEEFSDEDEPLDRLDDHAHEHEASEAWRREAPDDKLPCEIIHDEVVVKQSPREHAISRANEGQTQSRKEVTLPQTLITLPPPPPIYSSLVLPDDLAPRDRNLKPTGIVFRRDRKCAFDFAQSTLSSEHALWTDASHRMVGLKRGGPEHHGGIAVAQKLGQRWEVHSAYTAGVTNSMQLESLAILMALRRAVQEKRSGALGEGTVYICSDSDFSLQMIEKDLALNIATRKAVQGALPFEADMDDLECESRLFKKLDRLGVFRFGNHDRPEKQMAIRIGRGILEQYYELRKLGAWVEFHWVPAHSGLPGNEIADRMAALSCWWLAKVVLRPAQGIGLVIIPLKVLTFDEPWTRYCPHKGQPQYTAYMALQLLEETKMPIIIFTKAIEPASRNTTIVGPGGLALQPASKSTCPLLQPPSARPFPEQITPAEGIPEEVIPEEVIPREVIPREVIPREVIPQEVIPRGVVPREVILREGIPQEGILREEQKVAFPQRYARYVGRPRLEKVMPGAFQNIARLHPQLMPQPVHGQDSRYMIGRVGLSPHLTPEQCAMWAVRCQAAQPGRDAAATQSVQDHRRHLRRKYRWDEAHGAAQPDELD
ncbi:hypothetical protein SLS63_010108 [Diaporthe eres]|uniref:RNase H type-1 domain-containing protein n=1 Tax=Diaporthe eres TaxID=83184 RepID=A0ABR1NXS4_DIAER